jgi:dihydrofolate reductase
MCAAARGGCHGFRTRMPVETRIAAPRIELVVAAARNGVIGRGGSLPWHLPEDLRHFKRLTLGHPILMGRRTWDSLGRPLPGRQNLVLTRDPGFRPAGATAVGSLAEAAAAAGPGETLMVIGGAELYRLCLPSARVLHLTEVDADIEGDVRFPEWRRAEWLERAREPRPADARHAYPYAFVTLERRVP